MVLWSSRTAKAIQTNPVLDGGEEKRGEGGVEGWGCGTREMAERLRAPTTLGEDPVQFPTSTG